MIKNWLYKLAPFLLLTAIAVFGVLPLFKPGFFPTHDGEWMIIRFSDFHRSLVDGQWPVRWAGRLNFGFGYPVFNFLYPGTFYFTEFFHLVRFNFTESVKMAFVVSYFLSGLFMYLFVKDIAGRISALMSAVLYLFTPYRFVDMYVRGSLGESVAFIFPPLIFYAINKMFKARKVMRWCGFVSLGIAGLITTHNVIAYLFLPVIICYFIYLAKQEHNKSFIKYGILSLLLGIGLSAFFWLPALAEKRYTIFDNVVVSDFKTNFPLMIELIKPSWGFGPSRPGDPASMSFQMGIVNILIVISGLITIAIMNLSHFAGRVRDDKRNFTMIIFLLAVTLIALFFMTEFSKPVWNIVPLLPLIQFPWRILSVTTFSTAVLSGLLLASLFNNRIYKSIVGLLVIGVILLLNNSYIRPSGYTNQPDGYYSTNEDTTTVQNEYLPISAKNLPRIKAQNKIEIANGNGMVEVLKQKSNILEFDYKGTSGRLKINTAYFPGWTIKINDIEQKITLDSYGTIAVNVDEGISRISLRFTETSLRKFSNSISIISLMAIILFIFNRQFTMILHSIIVWFLPHTVVRKYDK